MTTTETPRGTKVETVGEVIAGEEFGNIYNYDFTGTVVVDGWDSIGSQAKPSGYSEEFGFDFYLDSPSIKVEYAVNLRITGRKIQDGSTRPRIRCQIEILPGDGPSVFLGGWLMLKTR